MSLSLSTDAIDIRATSDDIPTPTHKYDNMAIEGGGVLGIAYVGALKSMFDDKSIYHITSFAGSSAGSIIALLLAMRVDYKTLHSTVFKIDFKKFKDNSWFVQNINRLLNAFGFYSGDALLNFLIDIVRTTTTLLNPTFKDLHKMFNTNLIITGTNFTTCRTVYFSHTSHPDMPVCLACRLSCSIPYFFASLKYCGDYYIDGGTLNNYPINVFPPESNTIGLKLISSDDPHHQTPPTLNSIFDFSERLVACVHAQALRVHVRTSDFAKTVKISTGDISFINFNLTNADKQFLIDQGIDGMNKFLQCNPI